MAEATAPQLLSALVRIPLERVVPGPNARGNLGDVAELAMSIKALGMQKPLLVCDLGDGQYQILDGHRRYAAARMLRLPHVDAVLRRDAGEAMRIQRQLAMHAQAKEFDPIAEARALRTLMFEYNLSREVLARTVGKSPSWVRDRIALLQLDVAEQESVRQGRMSIASAQATVNMRRAQRDGRQPGRQVGQEPAQPQPRQHCKTCRCREVSR